MVKDLLQIQLLLTTNLNYSNSTKKSIEMNRKSRQQNVKVPHKKISG